MNCAHCEKEGPCPVKCEICCDVAYCSALCQQKDWTFHETKCNVYDVPKGVCVARPYMFEDMIDPKELKSDDLGNVQTEKNLLRTVDPKGLIGHVLTAPGVTKGTVQGSLGNLGVGEEPDPLKYGDTYRITIEQGEWLTPSGNTIFDESEEHHLVLIGSIPKDFIFKNNGRFALANDLAKSRRLMFKKHNKLLFYPTLADANYFELQNGGGSLRISVETYNASSIPSVPKDNKILSFAQLTLNYGDLQFRRFGKLLKRVRGITGAWSKQLKLKGLNPSNHAALRAKDAQSMEVRLIFETTGQEDEGKRLKDLELLVPIKILDKSRKDIMRGGGEFEMTEEQEDDTIRAYDVEFTVDPRDLESVTGCLWAWECAIAETKAEETAENQTKIGDQLASMHETLAVIQTHQLELENHINAALSDELGGQEELDYGNPRVRGLIQEAQQTFKYDPKVNAVFHDAQEELWRRIGLRLSKSQSIDKDLYNQYKNSPYDVIKGLADSRIRAFAQRREEAGQTRGGRLKRFLRGRKGKEQREMRALKQITTENLNCLNRAMDRSERTTSESYREWKTLDQRLANAIRGDFGEEGEMEMV